ncbi:unnamed protein product [Ilex paraguariensis]|uniref:BRCA1-associated protein n=1 Tax=Ilex paraguariensis TaxID=185542 RepID=A0ABC8TNF4_9AQUA
MFTLQMHTVDTPKPLFTTTSSATIHGPNPNNDNNSSSSNPTELRGVAHLFRHLPPTTTTATATPSSNTTARTTLLFVVAVPNYLSTNEFLLFCGSHLDHCCELIFLRNDAMEDRYSVLIRLENQLTADGFYHTFDGRRFKPFEAEVCHIYFTQSVEYTDSAEIAGTPPPGFTELPTCPVCLERLDQDTSGIRSTLCDHSFHCACISKWTYLSCQVCRLCQRHDEKPACAVCGSLKNPWVCLICGFVGCGRYEEGHAKNHWSGTQHCYSLELETQQIWDYVGDNYVQRLNQSKADGKSVMTNAHCVSLDGECGTCANNEDSGIGDALLSSKVEAIVDEYIHLLATQLETQRQHYESLLAEAKTSKESSISNAVDKAVFSRMQDMQYKLEKYPEEKKAVANRNRDLMKNDEALQKKLKEIQESESSSLRSRDQKILDLEEQIRDMKIYVEAHRMLANSTDSDGIKGGTLLPVQANQSSPGNTKRRTKPGRRRN